MSSTLGVVLLAVLSLTSVASAIECFKCKYDEKFALEKTLDDGFWNTAGCNTGAAWDNTKPKKVTCLAEDNFCRVYTYTLNDKTIIERSCAENCISNIIGVTETHGGTTSVKKTYCCHGDYCNAVLSEMSTTTQMTTTQDGNALSMCVLRLVFMCAVAWIMW